MLSVPISLARSGRRPTPRRRREPSGSSSPMAHWSWTRAARRTACRRIDDRHIEWTEEGIRIGAEIAELTADRLRLRIQLRSEIKEESYRPAKVPSVCPDMPRREGPVPGPSPLDHN